jgi:hypothetical protein
MKTTNSHDDSKPSKRKRRRGSRADEITKLVGGTHYWAKKWVKFENLVITTGAVELLHYVGETLKLDHAIAIMKLAPELVPHLVPHLESGKLTREKCAEIVRRIQALEEPELTFEEQVMRSFKEWLRKWALEDRREVFDLVGLMPYDAVAELLPAQTNLVVESTSKLSQAENQNEERNSKQNERNKSRGRIDLETSQGEK